jgi:hypothetical protein
MTRLSASDLESVLSFAEQAQADERPMPFTPELLDRLATLVGCEQAAFFEVDHPERMLHERITSYGPDRIGTHMPDELWTSARMVGLNRYKLARGTMRSTSTSTHRDDGRPRSPCIAAEILAPASG